MALSCLKSNKLNLHCIKRILNYPLPPGITNYGIAEVMYGHAPSGQGRNEEIEYPDFEEAVRLMNARKKYVTYMFSAKS